MKVQCVLCDSREKIDDSSIDSKKIRNHPLYLYTCPKCTKRISQQTLIRINSKNYDPHRPKSESFYRL